MAFLRYESLVLSPTTSGAYVANSAGFYTGFLDAVNYSPSTTAIPSTGGNITLASKTGGLLLLSLDDLSTARTGVYFPRSGTVTSTGATSTGARAFPLVNEQVQITISSGSSGGTKTATVSLYIGDAH